MTFAAKEKMAKFKIDRTIYHNKKKGMGFNVSYEERKGDYKLLIKRVVNGRLIGGALYYESLPKKKKFKKYYLFVIKTVEENIQEINNLYFWNFGEPILKHLLQHRE